MAILVVGSRPAAYSNAIHELGIEYDAVFDPEENPRTEGSPRRVFWRPYMAEPESVLGIPGLTAYDGIFGFTDFTALPAALATAALGLPSPSVPAVLRTRNKYLMRTTLREQGFAQPPFGIVGADEPRREDYPLIVKPIDGTGSAGIRHISTPGALAAIRPDGRLMWESYLEGAQYTVEGISWEKGHEAVAVTGKSVSGAPHFVVLEHETPAPIDPRTRQLLTSYAEDCLTGLGVTHTATHTEIVLRDGRPMLVETHTRPAGDLVPFLARLTTGRDQYALELGVGQRTPFQADSHPVVAPFARTLHLTPYDSLAVNLANPEWLGDFPAVVHHDLSRVHTPASSRYDASLGRDPRWGRIVIAGTDREALRRTGQAIRARALAVVTR